MMHLQTLMSRYLESLTGRGLARRTITTTRVVLTDLLRFLPGRDAREITSRDLHAYIDAIADRGWSPMTQESYINTVLRLFRWAASRDLLLRDPGEGVRPRKQLRDTRRRIPTPDEMAAILGACEAPAERALFELLYASGMRIAEASSLLLTDLDLAERVVLIRRGKGGRDRAVPFSIPARDALRTYLATERPRVLASAAEELRERVFLTSTGPLRWGRASRRWTRLCEQAGLGEAGYTLHSIRHACATHLIEAGAQVRYVQELLGHASLSTTQRYTRPAEERIKAVYRTYHPRENEHYREITDEYRVRAAELTAALTEGRERYQRYGQPYKRRGADKEANR